MGRVRPPSLAEVVSPPSSTSTPSGSPVAAIRAARARPIRPIRSRRPAEDGRRLLAVAPRLDLVGLVVSDMAASLAFYRRLGLAIPAEADAEPHVEVALPGGLRLAWDREDVIASFTPGWTPPSGGSERHGLAFLCDDPAEVDATYAALMAEAVEGHLEPWDAPWGQRYAVVLDPDGNSVDLFAPLAGE